MALSFAPTNATHGRAVGALFLAAIMWSSSGLFIKIVDWPALTLWGARGLVAAVFFLIWLRPKSWRFTRLQWFTAVAFMGTQLAFFTGTKVAPAANIIFLAYAAPIFIVPLSAWFLNEKPKKSDGFTLLIVFSGMLLFFADNFSTEGIWGNSWGVVTAMGLACLTIGMRLQKDGNPAESIFLGHAMAGLIGIPLLAQQTNWTIPITAGILYMGFFQIGLSFVLYSWAIKHIEALEATIITMIEPILNPLLVFWVIGEVPGRYAFIGAGLVFAGVLIRAFVSAAEQRPIKNEHERTADTESEFETSSQLEQKKETTHETNH